MTEITHHIANSPAGAGYEAAFAQALGGRAIRLIALDLDGTLLDSTKTLRPTVIEAVRACVQRGIHIVLATARPPRSVRTFHEQLGLNTPSIHYNGSLTHDLITSTNLDHQPIPVKIIQRIITAARQIDPTCAIHLEILDKWYTDTYNPDLIPETGRSFDPDFIGPLSSFLTVPVTKLMIQAYPQGMEALGAMMQRRFANDVAIAVSDRTMLQIMGRGLDKSTALQAIAAGLGVGAAETMAIGDAPNDLGMIRWAGVGVAMGSGWASVCDDADVIAPGCDEDGVAWALRAVLKSSASG